MGVPLGDRLTVNTVRLDGGRISVCSRRSSRPTGSRRYHSRGHEGRFVTLQPGQTIGRYQILEPLGVGGMATVYKAYQPSLEREVALKVLRPGFADDPEFFQRFQREARSIAKLRHPHIVQVFDFEPLDGRYVLAMEFLEGGTLKDRVTSLAQEGKRLSNVQIARIVSEVSDALTYAHELGIVHRDVKPSNVMLAGRDRSVVTDFGIAKIVGGEGQTQTGVGIGTPEYMAPEQGTGAKVDHRADIYSLGVVAYELLTGRVPFVADTPIAIVVAHIRDPLPLPSSIDPSVSPETERVLLKALAKDPGDRYVSATDFADALRTTLVPAGLTAATVYPIPAAGAPTAAMGAVRVAAPGAAKGLPRSALIAAALVVLLLVAAGGTYAFTRGTAAPPAVGAIVPTGGTATTPPPNAAVTNGLLFELDLTKSDQQLAKRGTNVQLRALSDAAELTLPKASFAQIELTPPVFTSDFDMTMQIRILNGTGRIGIAFHTGTDLSMQFSLNNQGQGLLQRQVLGGAQQPTTVAQFSTRPDRNNVDLRVVAKGTAITMYIAGVEVAKGTEPELRTGMLALIVGSFDDAFSVQLRQLRITGTSSAGNTAPGGSVQQGNAVASGAGGYVPTPAPVTGVAPFASLRGAEIAAPKLDGTPGEVTITQDPDQSIRVGGGAIEISAPQSPGSSAQAEFNVALPSSGVAYASQMTVAFGSGSTMRFAFCFRRDARPATYCFNLLTAPGSGELRYQDGRGGQVAVGGTVQIADLRGRSLTLGLVVDGQRFTVFIDDRAVLQVSDTNITTSSTMPYLEAQRLASSPTQTGTARISNVHFYRLAGQ